LKDERENYEKHHRSKGGKEKIHNAAQEVRKEIGQNCEKILKSLTNIANDLTESTKYILNKEKKEKVLNEIGEIKEKFLYYSELDSYLSDKSFKKIEGFEDRRYEELLNIEIETIRDVGRFAEYEKSVQESLPKLKESYENAVKTEKNNSQNSVGSSGYLSESDRSSSSSKRGSDEQKFADKFERSEISSNPKTQFGGKSVKDLISQFENPNSQNIFFDRKR